MQCPACASPLTEFEAESVHVDVCSQGCGGVWFDNFELWRFDEASEAAGAPLLDQPGRAGPPVDREARRRCPRCETQLLLRHFYSPAREAEVDSCPRCNGVWLDMGELRAIRGAFTDDSARDAMSAHYFESIFVEELQTDPPRPAPQGLFPGLRRFFGF